MRNTLLVGIIVLAVLFIVLAPYPDLWSSNKGNQNNAINGTCLSEKNANIIQSWAKIELKPLPSGFREPTYLTNAKDGTGRIFVVEKEGRINIIKDGKTLPEPFLDIVFLVRSKEYERGLVSVAFHPNYRGNGRFFVNYTNLNGDTILSGK